MPGLTGMLTYHPSEQYRVDFELMTESLLRQAHFSSGSYVNEALGVMLGWTCHKNSFADCMPIWNAKKDKCLFFFGEDFSDSHIKESLRANGHCFDDGDASYLIHLYEEKGNDFFKLLNGFFHGVLINEVSKEVIIFNDRFGMQRIYYHQRKNSFLFSAEAKALLKLCPELRCMDYESLAQLITMGCVLDGSTLYKGVNLLAGATLLRFKNRKIVETKQYFDRSEWENQPPLGKKVFYRCLRDKIATTIPKYFCGPEDVGVSLTGGLDTRIIMANAPASPGRTPCYTFGSMYRDGFDVKVARKVANLCGQHHTTIRIDRQFLENFPSLAKDAVYISDGLLDAGSGAAELYANRRARLVAPIRMTGSHGSEVLRSINGVGYRLPNESIFDRELGRYMADALEIFRDRSHIHRLSYASFFEAPFFNYPRISVEQSQVTKRSPFMDNDLLALLYRAPYAMLTSDEVSLQLVSDKNAQLANIITNRGVGGASQNSLFGWTQRWHELLKLAEFGYDYDMPEICSRIDQYLSRLHFEHLFLGWVGFYHYRKWYRDELSPYIEDILLDDRSRARPYYQKGVIEKMVRGHIGKGLNYGREINAALTLELTQRTLIENQEI